MFVSESSCVAYCAELESKDLAEVLRSVIKSAHRNDQPSVLVSVAQRRFLMCLSPFSSRFENKILKTDSGLQNYGTETVEKLFRELRKVTFLLTGHKTVLFRQKELVALAESKVRRNILSKKITLRRIDSETAVKLLKAKILPESKPDECCLINIEKKQSGQKKSNVKIGYTSNTIKSIAPRRVRCQNPEENLEYTVLPQDGTKFNNPSFPVQRESSIEKYPVQATTDDEADGPSTLAINTPSLYGSHDTRVTSTYSYNSASATNVGNRQASKQSMDIDRSATPPRYRDYETSGKRLSSFKTPRWFASEKPDVSTLVDHGFFFTGREDLVRCYQCGIGLKDWMRDDDVLREHVKYSSACTHLLKIVSRHQIERIKFENESGPASSSTQSSALQAPFKVQSPKYQTVNARLESFKSFPSSVGIRTQLLAVAGLYYTGQGDLCRCFACDGGLKDWSADDDPCSEHARHFPKCGYIKQLKGEDFIRARQQERQNFAIVGVDGANATAANDTYTPTLQSMGRHGISNTVDDQSDEMVRKFIENMGYTESDVTNAKAKLEIKGDKNPTADKIINALLDMKEMSSNGVPIPESTPETDLEEHQRLKKQLQCMLCVSQEPDVLFLPCAHHRVCHNCAEKLTCCPKCNINIQEKVRTYMA